MAQTAPKKDKVLTDKRYLEELEKKASFLEEILDLVEDKYLGELMERSENEEDIPLSKARSLLQ